MQAGDLTESVSIRRSVESADGAGGKTIIWSDFITGLWAEIEPQSGRESIRNGRLGARPIYLVRVRAPLDVTVLDRLIWQGREYNIIEAVPPVSRAAFLTLLIEQIF